MIIILFGSWPAPLPPRIAKKKQEKFLKNDERHPLNPPPTHVIINNFRFFEGLPKGGGSLKKKVWIFTLGGGVPQKFGSFSHFFFI